MKTGVLLSVREKATRLPGKVLKPLGRYSVTEHLLRRLQEVNNADEVILSTSIDPSDTVLVEIADGVGVNHFRGSEDDKLVRYRDTARSYCLDFILIVDGDDPFCSVEHMEGIIEYAVANHKVDYVQYNGLPIGATGFGIRLAALERMCQEKTQHNTEVWQHFFKDSPKYRSFLLEETRPLYNHPEIRMTLDYPEDYVFFTKVVNELEKNQQSLEFKNIMIFLNDHPEIVGINKKLQDIYAEHLEHSMIEKKNVNLEEH